MAQTERERALFRARGGWGKGARACRTLEVKLEILVLKPMETSESNKSRVTYQGCLLKRLL
jgi:hypothetical protein